MTYSSIHYRPTIAEIDLNALRHNFMETQNRVSAETKIMAIVKANAYGHGALMIAKVLKTAGAHGLGVATLEEGIELRANGIRGDIFILDGLLGENIEEFFAHHFKPILSTREDVGRLGIYTKEKQKECEIHIKLDTGMGRLGFLPGQIEELIKLLQTYQKIKVEGILTHLASADEPESEPTDRQLVLFSKLLKILESKGIVAASHHANSAAILDGKILDSQWVRPGIMLYGAYPNPRHQAVTSLKPVMTLKTKILSLKKFPSGTSLSYGGTFTTQRESFIACLPIGYADGYPRLISNRGQALVCGMRAPVVGRVCMDLMLVDVTDVPNVAWDDEVVLIGKQGNAEIRAEEVAAWAETISYEIFCGISARVPRVYLNM